MSKKTERTRYWGFILYQESMPEHALEIMESWHIPIAVSPLHNQDVWGITDKEVISEKRKAGEKKKEHYHVVMMFNSLKSSAQALQYAEQLGIKHVEPIGDIGAYGRYLCHLDNPEKAQYNENDIVFLSGADLDLDKKLTLKQQREISKKINAYIVDNNITEYHELIFGLQDYDSDMYYYAFTHTVAYNAIIRSIRHSKME